MLIDATIGYHARELGELGSGPAGRGGLVRQDAFEQSPSRARAEQPVPVRQWL